MEFMLITSILSFPDFIYRWHQGENLITQISDLDKCIALKILHLRGNGETTNQLETLDGFSKNMVALQYLNLRLEIIFSILI